MERSAVTDDDVLSAIADIVQRNGCWATLYDLQERFRGDPYTPEGREEMRQAVARLCEAGFVSACLCGCRMDAEMTSLGWRRVGRDGPRPFLPWRDVGGPAFDPPV
jgi:hypothetical protein